MNQAHQYFIQRWCRIRANLHDNNIDFLGLYVYEFHKDGTPHYHALIYVDESNFSDVSQICANYFNESTVDIKYQDQTDKDKAKASTYMLKYIMKTLSLNKELFEKLINN